ncbi:hypothetical protein, partial [Klebsiella pneumoniae]|uniref:hypothetical protein n=1 Tax=Klebsiella pneumoniae TaxID=573 RepID=UPI003EE3FBF5
GAGEGSDHSVYTASIGEAPTRLNAADPAGAVYDRPWSASTGERLYVVYERESAGKKSVVLSSSDDGEHFSSDVVAEGGVLPTVCASGNNVAVAWV